MKALTASPTSPVAAGARTPRSPSPTRRAATASLAQRLGEAMGDGHAEQQRAREQSQRSEQQPVREAVDRLLDARGGHLESLRAPAVAEHEDVGGVAALDLDPHVAALGHHSAVSGDF